VTAPLVPLALAFATGVWLGLEVAPPGWVTGAALGLAGVVGLAIRRGRLGPASAGLLVLVVLAGWARVALPDPWPPLEGLRGGSTQLEGLVTGDPEPEGPRTRVPLLLETAADAAGRRVARGQLTVLLYGPVPPVAPLDRIAVTVELTEPPPLHNPGGGPGLGYERSGPHFLAVGRSESTRQLAPGGGPWWLAVRDWVHRLVQRQLPPVSGALFEGLLVGERRQLPATLVADFRAAGVFHILASPASTWGWWPAPCSWASASSGSPRGSRPRWP
jgi:predicted membrane metal-binding protein